MRGKSSTKVSAQKVNFKIGTLSAGERLRRTLVVLFCS